MIRKDVLRAEADDRVVRYYLTAAAFALSLGLLVEFAGPKEDVAQRSTPADTAVAVTARVAT